MPVIEVFANPAPGVLKRWLRTVIIAAHVGGDAVLVREVKQRSYLPHIDQIDEICQSSHRT